MVKLGIMGGTFDPIHNGHLIIAQEVAYKLSLERVLFVPAADPPHKQQQLVERIEHRLQMVRLAIAGNPTFELSTIEIERAGLSYTVDTLETLHQQQPDSELYFIIGADAAADLLQWHKPERIIELARLAAVGRPGYELPLDKLLAALPQLHTRLERVTAPLVEIAAHEIRERICKGAPVKYLVPPVIEEYIRHEQLYI